MTHIQQSTGAEESANDGPSATSDHLVLHLPEMAGLTTEQRAAVEAVALAAARAMAASLLAKNSEPMDTRSRIRAIFPQDMKHPLTVREINALARIGDLDAYDLLPSSPIWDQPQSKRWPEVWACVGRWKQNRNW